MRKLLSMLLFVVLVTAGLAMLSPAAQAADTGNAAPQTGKIVSDEPGKNAPNILDGTVYSIAKVGNTIVVGGQFTQAQNYNTSTTLTRRNVLAFDATTGKILTSFAPDPLGTVFKVLPAADGTSVYVAGGFTSAAGKSMPGRLFKINVSSGVVDPSFTAPTISGDIRDLDLIGNHLFLGGKFTHINGVAQKALGTVYADTGKRDPYFNAVFSGLHRPEVAGAVTNVLQLSINKQNNQLVAVGNFTNVANSAADAVQARSQIVKFNVGNTPTTVDTTVHQTLSTWTTNLFTSGCSSKFDTYMSDVEFSPDGSYFVVSTSGAYGGASSNTGTVGCDVVARFESNSTTLSPATWTAYTGGDTTWTVEVTDNVIYTGGHMRWQNNPGAGDTAGPGAVSREGIAALNPVNGLPYSWNPTRARGVGVQDLLATSEGLYVGSDTELLGHTAGNTYHARIGVLPLATGTRLPQMQSNNLPVDLYKVATGSTVLQKRSFTGTTAGTAANVPTGPGWGTSTGAFMVNGVLYKLNTDGSLSKMTFDGTNYGPSIPVNTADALVAQTGWHTDVKTLTSIFYSNGFIYYTMSGTATANNVLYRRSFEIEDGVVGQQRFTTSTTSVDYRNVRGAFVAGGKMYFASSSGNLWAATWNQAGHTPVTGTAATVSTAGTGWSSRALFPYQVAPAPVNEPPVANANITCELKVCTFDGTSSTDPENGALTYDWDFGDGTSHGSGATTTHTYAGAGNRTVTLIVTDNKGATNSITKTASPTNHADSISFRAKNNNSGNRSTHTIGIPATVQSGDTLLLFLTSNSSGSVYSTPAGWTQVLSDTSTGEVGKLYTKTATGTDAGSNVTILSTTTAGAAATVKSDLTLAAYDGAGSPAITEAQITSQAVADPVHMTPTVTAPDGTQWLVSFWSDKSTTASGTATDWSGPVSQTQRSEGTASGTSHVSSLLMDSNGRVSGGSQGGLNATSSVSASGLTMSILLAGEGEPVPNQPPVSNPTLTNCTQLTCTFSATSSTDPEGGLLTYDWNWGDNTAHSNSPTPSHAFSSGGNKTVTLTVTDNQGATNSDTVVATPTDPPANTAPTANITGEGCSGMTCTANGSTSSDPDSDTLTYDWNWGDGTAHSTTANPLAHKYTTLGAKTITLTVSDGNGHTAVDTATVTPTNAAPTAKITGQGCTNLACTVNGSTSTDPDGDTLSYDWDWDDGTPHGDTATATHTYAAGDAGDKTVVLTVTDPFGNSDTENVTLTPAVAGNAAPTARITDVSCIELTCSFTGDTSSDPENSDLTYSWTFGDGGTSTDTNPSHTYTSSGAKNVTLTVNDGTVNSAPATDTANPTDPVVNPVSNVTFVGTASNVGNSTLRTVTMPPGVQVGDTLVLFLGAASTARTYTAPAGWTLLESEEGSSAMGVQAWTKRATATEAAANAKVSVTISAATKADLTVGVYRGTDATTPIADSAAKIDNAAGAAHTSPAVTATNNTSWLVTYWADRSNTSTAWTAPASQTVRWPGQPDTSSAHALGLLADSNAAVASGPQGLLTATANGDSSRGASVSILLNSN